VSYCINPKCQQRYNPDSAEVCQACGTPLLIQKRYRLVKPLREIDLDSDTEIFAVDDSGTTKVLKVLKNSQFISMLAREVQALQQLKHPGIPSIESSGYFTVLPNSSTQELHCLVMEFIAGENLEVWLEKHQPISNELALKWLRQLLEILDLLHENHLFHRDIKLSNIMLKPDGQLVLIDFGTVREVTNTYLAKIGGGRDLTSIISPGYTPLEQVNGKAVPQSDFYALGRSFVYLLTGKHPLDFPEDSQTGMLQWRESASQIYPHLANLIDELIAPFPGKRPLSTQEILQRLANPNLLSAKKISVKLRINWLIALNIGLLIVNLITGFLWLQTQQQSRDRGGEPPIYSK
jgi:serine/threonine protein kinase